MSTAYNRDIGTLPLVRLSRSQSWLLELRVSHQELILADDKYSPPKLRTTQGRFVFFVATIYPPEVGDFKRVDCIERKEQPFFAVFEKSIDSIKLSMECNNRFKKYSKAMGISHLNCIREGGDVEIKLESVREGAKGQRLTPSAKNKTVS